MTAFIVSHVGLVIVKIALWLGVGRWFKQRRAGNSVSAEGRTIHWARWYDPLVKIMARGRDDDIRTMTVDLARIAEGQQVLDLGCGTGDLTYAISRRVGSSGRAVGIDAAMEMVERAGMKFGDSAEFQHAPAEKLPFEENEFDVVVSSLVLHHLPENLKQATILEAYRVLKPGGHFYSVDFVGNDSDVEQKGLLARLHSSRTQESSIHQLRNVLESTGFHAVTSGQTPQKWLGFLEGTK